MDIMDDYDMKKRRVNIFGTGVLVGILLMTVLVLLLDSGAPDKADLEHRIEAYDECMNQAAPMRCHMTVADFIDYYDLKYKLLQEED